MAHTDAPSPCRSRIVLVKGIDGLGNRVLSLLSAILYARLAGRGVVADWRDGTYADAGVDAFPLLFDSDSVASWDGPLSSASVAPWMWEDRLHLSAAQVCRSLGPGARWNCPFVGELFSFDPGELEHPAEVLVTWSSVHCVGRLRRHFSGRWREWRTMGDEAILARLLAEELAFHPEIVARAEEIRRAWPERTWIGVHVRNTDRTTNLARLFWRLDALIARKPNAGVFLATDDAGVEALCRVRYPVVTTVPKWFPSSGPLHRLSSPCPDRLAMARASLVEMRLLASCDDLVINGNSSFSLITKLLWRGDPRRVVDVADWSWLPSSVRERAWRLRDGVKWMGWLRRARGHIDGQRPGQPAFTARGEVLSEAAASAGGLPPGERPS